MELQEDEQEQNQGNGKTACWRRGKSETGKAATWWQKRDWEENEIKQHNNQILERETGGIKISIEHSNRWLAAEWKEDAWEGKTHHKIWFFYW
jgi:hypothetical protein